MKKRWITELRQRLSQGWTFMRLLRLGLGILIAVEALRNGDILLGLFGIILLMQAFFNVGCCGSYGCDINHVSDKQASMRKGSEDISFEEVK